MEQEVLTQLKRSRLFHGVDIKQLQVDLDACALLPLPRGTILLKPDKPNSSIYFVITGELIVTYDPVDMDVMSRLLPSDCVGEISFMDNNAPTTYVVAAVDSTVLEVPQDRMWQMLKRVKDFPLNMLELLVERFREKNELLRGGLSLMRHYQSRSEIDALTGLYNRSWCDEVFPRQLDLCARAGQHVSLAMLDLDHFKQVNDRYGHAAGDAVLRQTAKLLRDNLRVTDLAARYGGEEFIIMLPTTPVDEVIEKLNLVRQQIQNARFDIPDGQTIACTLSVGVAEWHPGVDLHALMVSADDALYRAKNNGRNQLVLERRRHQPRTDDTSNLDTRLERRQSNPRFLVLTA